MKPSLVALCALVGLPLSLLGWSVVQPNYRELRLHDGTVVLGSNHGVWWTTRQYFSVRLENARPGSKLRSTARLALRGRELVLRDLTPKDLEFVFAGTTLQGFYARCADAAACDFELSWPGRSRFRLPVSEVDVPAVRPDVVSTSDHYWH